MFVYMKVDILAIFDILDTLTVHRVNVVAHLSTVKFLLCFR